MNAAELVPRLLAVACLLPLGAGLAIAAARPVLGGTRERLGGWIATAAIGAAFVLAKIALTLWLLTPDRPVWSGSYGLLAAVGTLRLGADYRIDGLTLLMFCLVSGIALLVHVYAFGYLAEEASPEPVVDAEVRDAAGRPLARPGRMATFYQYLGLFCFSMLGLILAGNLLLIFAFWELVGLTSYLLIGFYRERISAAGAAAQAFLVNRVGDVGFLAGLGLIWAATGTWTLADAADGPGLYSLFRPGTGETWQLPPGFAAIGNSHAIPAASPDVSSTPNGLPAGYVWCVLAGLGLLCGAIGKSAQFPLHVWLPDAMAGPTPVSALVHSATMVAAGVYFVGRLHPLLPAEVLLVTAYIGLATLLLGAAFALTATDLKRVLAFSTISQLGYMLLGLGVGAWHGGLFHLFTHACFKSLLFLGAGAVIHAVHEQDLHRLGGLRKFMPWTAGTLLVAALAMVGAGLPFVDLGLAGYYSKDAILAQAYVFRNHNPLHAVLYWGPLLGAALTGFYIFRLWLLTFAGTSRAAHAAHHHPHPPQLDHADPAPFAAHAKHAAHAVPHDPGWAMRGPLVVLATLSVIAAWNLPFTGLGLGPLLESARLPAVAAAHGHSDHAAEVVARGTLWNARIPAEHLSHDGAVHRWVSLSALAAAAAGVGLAFAFYGGGTLRSSEVRNQFRPIYELLRAEGHLLPLYRLAFVVPTQKLGVAALWFDRTCLDPALHALCGAVLRIASLGDRFDRRLVDGLVQRIADTLYGLGLSLRGLQTGRLRQYLLCTAVGLIAVFWAIGWYAGWAAAGP